MTTRDITAKLAEEVGLPKQAAWRIVKILCETVSGALARGETVRLAGLGTFKVVERTGRAYRLPSGETRQVPPRKVVCFRPCAALKQAVRAGR